MQQLTYIKTNHLKWEEVTEPTITAGNEALVRPFLVARCDLDAAFLRNDIFKRYSIGKMLGMVDKTVPDFTRKTF